MLYSYFHGVTRPEYRKRSPVVLDPNLGVTGIPYDYPAWFTRGGILLLYILNALAHSDLDVPHLDLVQTTVQAAVVFFAFVTLLRRPLRRLPGTIYITLGLVTVWKLIETARSFEPRSALLTVLNFIFLAVIWFVVIPNMFTFRTFMRGSLVTLVVIFVSFILLHPYVPDKTLLAGWNKAPSWMFAHPNGAGMFALSIFLSACGMIAARRKRHELFAAWAVIVAAGIVLVVTRSRTSELSALVFVAAFTLVMIFLRLLRSRRVQVRGIGYLLVTGLVGSFLYGIHAWLSGLTERALDVLLSNRLTIWGAILESIPGPHGWVLGVGMLPAGVNTLFSTQYAGGFGIDGTYVDVLYTEGVVGLILFVATMLLIGVFCTARPLERRLRAIGLGLVATAMASSSTETHFWLVASPLSFVVLGGCSVLLAQRGRVECPN